MEKVRLGKTGLVVTGIGWGGIPIQRVGEDEAVSVIRAVVEMGVDLLDTARAYSNSEHRIGLALEGVHRPVVLSTKSQVRTARIYDEVHESLRQLKVKKIDIYHLHMVPTMEEYEKVMASGGAYEGLLRARDEGLIDHIGMSSHNLDVLARRRRGPLRFGRHGLLQFSGARRRRKIVPPGKGQRHRRHSHETFLRRGYRGCGSRAQVRPFG